MNRKEIIKEINYHGEYTKDVKQRLKKLIKKYHPDNNKDDKETILILYEIKKQLEKGTLKYNNYSNVKFTQKSNDNANEKKYISFLENMIEMLQKKKKEIDSKIRILYKKLNEHIDIKNKMENELGRAEFDVDKLNKKLEKSVSVTIKDKIFIILIILFCFFSIVFRSFLLLICSIVFLTLEMYYMYIRYSDYIKITKSLQKYRKKLDKVSDRFNKVNLTMEQFKKDEIELKKEKRKISNDIQFYNHELNKVKENKISKEKEINKEEKNYVKK